MKGYKGFSKGLICRGKQYAENTVFEEEKAVICNSGMHFCENPFDVLDYYGFVDADGALNEFAEVEALADVKTDNNKKFCTTKLKIGAKLDLSGFVKACIDFVLEKTVKDGSSDNVDTDNYAQIGSSGNYAKIGSSGNYAQIGSSGNYAQIDSTGADSVICCAGPNSVVRAKKGSWITLAEWEYSAEKERLIPMCVKTEFVDGERIKEDTLYCLEGGEFKEVEPHE